jgi:hypothetical protein
MNINIIQLEENDTIIVDVNIKHIHPADVDSYIKNIMDTLEDMFGKRPIAAIPTRKSADDRLEFNIIRQPKNKIS